MDMGVEPYLLAAALRAVLAQRLVRRLCPACRVAVPARGRELTALGPLAARLAGRTVWGPAGCSACLGGYRGRLGLFELLVVDDDVRERVRAGAATVKGLQAEPAGGRRETLLDDGLAKVVAGETSLAEVVYAVGHGSG
jgi:type II secretory ATPase GspE/PulE/Tfp pilus assembly ATPase PilB-like protein